MLKVRVIPCLDVKDGRVVKGVNFVNLRDAGDPVEAASAYDEAGADELCFLDITASHENRDTIFDVVERTAERCFMPLTVGGGVRKLDDVRKLLEAGADKVSINTAAVKERDFVRAAAEKFGAQCIVGGESTRRGAHEVALLHRRGVDRHLVGAGLEQLAHIVELAHASADGERHEAALGGAFNHVEDGIAVLVACGDVEEAELVGAGLVIGRRGFDGVAGVAQIDEVDAFDDAAILNIEAGNDTDLEHERDLRVLAARVHVCAARLHGAHDENDDQHDERQEPCHHGQRNEPDREPIAYTAGRY